MEGSYEVYLDTQPVGKVQVRREGLYYSLRCHCHLTGDSVYRLVANLDGRQENLGVVVPDEDGGFSLNRKIAAKYLGEGPVRFSLSRKREHVSGEFVPIRPEEPFAYLDRLNKSFLEYRNGQPGIRL